MMRYDGFMRLIAAFAIGLILFAGCTVAGRDRSVVYAEEGFVAAERQWHLRYNERLGQCAEAYPPGSEGAEECFGSYYDADAHVETAVKTVVSLLRAYWVARAAGKSPDWAEVAAQVTKIIRDLPPEARQYFERVKGL